MANCPFCRRYFRTNPLLYEHINREHSEALENSHMDAPQAVYYSIHKTLHGKCVCGCGRETDWNPKTGKPYRLSNDPSCKQRMRVIALENHRKIYGKDTLLNDMDHQKEMQKHRPTAGEYQFSDGGTVSYLSSLEHAFLVFCDQVMEFTSNMIVDAPQVFLYYDPKTKTQRKYLPDFYLPDYNLIVEIKDGGKHPNGNPVFQKETKYKVAYKDDVMRKQTKYNYIKITDKDYTPFVELLYRIVRQTDSTKKNDKPFIVIDEASVKLKNCAEEIPQFVTSYLKLVDSTKLLLGYGIMSSIDGDYFYWYSTEEAKLYRYELEGLFFFQGELEFYSVDPEKIQNCVDLINEIEAEGYVEKYVDLFTLMQDHDLYFTEDQVTNDNTKGRMDFFRTKRFNELSESIHSEYFAGTSLKEDTVVDDQGTSHFTDIEPWFRRIDQRGGADSDHEFYPDTELGPNTGKDTTDFTRSYSIL